MRRESMRNEGTRAGQALGARLSRGTEPAWENETDSRHRPVLHCLTKRPGGRAQEPNLSKSIVSWLYPTSGLDIIFSAVNSRLCLLFLIGQANASTTAKLGSSRKPR